CRTSRNGAFNDCGGIRIYVWGWGGRGMKSLVAKRFIVIDGHKTSVSLENAFWPGLKKIAQPQKTALADLVEKIDETREQGNLSSAIRLYVLEYFRNQHK